MATQFGTSGVFGLDDFQAGVIQESNSWNYTDKKKFVMSKVGDDVGSVHYGERVEGTISGLIPATSAFSGTLASAITLTDAPTDFLKGSLGTSVIVDSISVTQSNEDYQKIEISWYSAF